MNKTLHIIAILCFMGFVFLSIWHGQFLEGLAWFGVLCYCAKDLVPESYE